MKDYLYYYKAYRLVKVSEPYKPYIKGQNNGWWVRALHGTCRLELLIEAESMDEIMAQIPMLEMYYEVGYRNVKSFVFVNGLKFRGLHLYSGQNCVSYHADGTTPIKGELAFQYIYESFDNEIIFIASSWNAEKLTDMQLSFERGKEYHLYYDLQFST